MKNFPEQCPKSADSISIKYSETTFTLNLPKRIDILGNFQKYEAIAPDEIFKHIDSATVYSDNLMNIIKNSKKVLIIIPDITRKSGAELILPRLIQLIENEDKNFSVIFATGTHRKLTDDEKIKILTPEIYEKYKEYIIDHDPDDMNSLEYFGKTKMSTPVLLNKAYMEYDTIIPIASVSYHYFAGFGGGRKMIVPGIASRKTAMNNHKLAVDFDKMQRAENAVTGNLKNNPVNSDIVEAVMIARRGKTFFMINTILNEKGEIIFINGGDLFVSHIEATNKLKNLTEVKVNKKYDTVIVSCGGFPKDINMIQAQKSLDRVVPLVRDGGEILFFAKCQDGYGNKYFQDFFDIKTARGMFESLANDYQINRQTAFNLKSIVERFDTYLYSDFDEENTTRMGFKKLNNFSEMEKMISDSESVAFVPDAYNSFFG